MARRFYRLSNNCSYLFYLCCLFVIGVILVLVHLLTKQYLVSFWPDGVGRKTSPFIVRTFAEEWLRLNKARVDWQAVLKPCLGNIAWATRTSGFEKEMATSAELSYIEAMSIRPAGEFSKILLRTLTTSGQVKSTGGDFWTVVFKGPSCVYATVFDHGDGTYEAMVLLKEPGVYNVEIFIHYTLCEGLKDPPENWFRVGNVYGREQPEGALPDKNDLGYNYKQLQNNKTLVIEVMKLGNISNISTNGLPDARCSSKCKALWNGFGRWANGNWIPFINDLETDLDRNPNIEIQNRFGQLRIYGDSLARRFYESLSSNILCKKIFKSCDRNYNWVYPLPKESESLAMERERNDDLDFRPEIVLNSIRDVLGTPDMKKNDSVLVLSLGVHYLITINFTTYQELIKDVIKLVKSREEFGCKAKVIWKTLTAMHKERIEGTEEKKARLRFSSPQRVELFDKFAMSAMCEAGIEVLDVYHLSASYPHGSMDAVHYKNSVFYSAESTLTRYILSGFGNNLVYICI